MTQQVLADRIGKSKSWVDKVERGVRTLEKLPMIETVAGALGVAPQVLLARKASQTPATDATTAVEGVRQALARYQSPTCGNDRQPSLVPQLDHQTGYAWTAYRNGHHQQVLRVLPDLIEHARHLGRTPLAEAYMPDLLVRVYRLTAQVLVKLGEPHLAWLAADRAMTAAAGHPHRSGLATISLTQTLRALRQGRLAMTAAVTALHHLDPTTSGHFPPDDPALTGALLTEAALAAATYGDTTTAAGFLDRAARIATAHRWHHRDHEGLHFDPTTVDLTRALTALRLGDHHRAIVIHQSATAGDAWRRLPAEHRAAHLIDITRAHLDLGDHRAAGRALLAADGIAPAEVRLRPTAHAALNAVLRAGRTPADIARLATTIGLTRG